jgi:hypothetical protein
VLTRQTSEQRVMRELKSKDINIDYLFFSSSDRLSKNTDADIIFRLLFKKDFTFPHRPGCHYQLLMNSIDCLEVE